MNNRFATDPCSFLYLPFKNGASHERTRNDGIRRRRRRCRPGRPVVRDPPQTAQAGDHRLRDREGLDHRRADSVRRGDRAATAGCIAARLARQPAADLRASRRGRVLAAQQEGGRKLPVPPGMRNHGNFIVSLGALCAWLAPQAEALGVDVFPGFAAADTIFNEDGSVAGVRIGDMGVAKDGSHKPGTPKASTSRPRSPCLPKAHAAA
jgi:hypothetical protein